MNRADLLLSVLQDGREHSRADIVAKVGFFLTNNAASELRARGVGVHHRVRDGLHVYSLSAVTESSKAQAAGSPVSVPALNEPPGGPRRDDGNPNDGDGQLVLHIPRSTYEDVAA